MGEIRPKRCEGVGITWRGAHIDFRTLAASASGCRPRRSRHCCATPRVYRKYVSSYTPFSVVIGEAEFPGSSFSTPMPGNNGGPRFMQPRVGWPSDMRTNEDMKSDVA